MKRKTCQYWNTGWTAKIKHLDILMPIVYECHRKGVFIAGYCPTNLNMSDMDNKSWWGGYCKKWIGGWLGKIISTGWKWASWDSGTR